MSSKKSLDTIVALHDAYVPQMDSTTSAALDGRFVEHESHEQVASLLRRAFVATKSSDAASGATTSAIVTSASPASASGATKSAIVTSASPASALQAARVLCANDALAMLSLAAEKEKEEQEEEQETDVPISGALVSSYRKKRAKTAAAAAKQDANTENKDRRQIHNNSNNNNNSTSSSRPSSVPTPFGSRRDEANAHDARDDAMAIFSEIFDWYNRETVQNFANAAANARCDLRAAQIAMQHREIFGDHPTSQQRRYIETVLLPHADTDAACNAVLAVLCMHENTLNAAMHLRHALHIARSYTVRNLSLEMFALSAVIRCAFRHCDRPDFAYKFANLLGSKFFYVLSRDNVAYVEYLGATALLVLQRKTRSEQYAQDLRDCASILLNRALHMQTDLRTVNFGARARLFVLDLKQLANPLEIPALISLRNPIACLQWLEERRCAEADDAYFALFLRVVAECMMCGLLAGEDRKVVNILSRSAAAGDALASQWLAETYSRRGPFSFSSSRRQVLHASQQLTSTKRPPFLLRALLDEYATSDNATNTTVASNSIPNASALSASNSVSANNARASNCVPANNAASSNTVANNASKTIPAKKRPVENASIDLTQDNDDNCVGDDNNAKKRKMQ